MLHEESCAELEERAAGKTGSYLKTEYWTLNTGPRAAGKSLDHTRESSQIPFTVTLAFGFGLLSTGLACSYC
jgi:hypothetical protein